MFSDDFDTMELDDLTTVTLQQQLAAILAPIW